MNTVGAALKASMDTLLWDHRHPELLEVLLRLPRRLVFLHTLCLTLFHFHFNFMTSPWSDITSSHLGEQYSLKLIIGKVIMELERNRIYSDANRVFLQSNFSNPLIQVSTSSFISVVTDTVFGSITVLGTVTIDPTVTSTVSSFVCQQDCLSSTGKLPSRIQS